MHLPVKSRKPEETELSKKLEELAGLELRLADPSSTAISLSNMKISLPEREIIKLAVSGSPGQGKCSLY